MRSSDERIAERAFIPANVAAFIKKWAPAGADLKTLTEYAEHHPDHIACHDAVQPLHLAQTRWGIGHRSVLTLFAQPAGVPWVTVGSTDAAP
ncbi:MAG: hypothetical protein U0Q21_10205 [Dermatophilaceae bacterium]